MNIKYASFLLIPLLFLPALGCGSSNRQQGDVTLADKPAKTDNPQVREFNQQLGAIEDQASAEKAVNSFVNYVDSRLARPTGEVGASSLRALMTTDLIKAVAHQELYARQEGAAGAMSSNYPEAPKPLLDVGTITDTVNELGKEAGVRVDDETVNSVKSAVEASVPNLNPAGKAEMTPLNALVVGYAIGSGDDGSAAAGSVEIPAAKLGAFVETITQ